MGRVGSKHRGEFWVEDAFARGALGAVASRRRVVPWAGKFALEVADANLTLCRLAKCLAKAKLAKRWLYGTEFDAPAVSIALAREDLSLLEDLTEQIARRSYLAAA